MSADAALAAAVAQLEAARAAQDIDAVVRVIVAHKAVMLRSGQAVHAIMTTLSEWKLTRRGVSRPSLSPAAAHALLDAVSATLRNNNGLDEAAHACFLLSLVCGSAVEVDDAWTYAFLQAGLAEALVAVMRRHRSAIKVQAMACAALAEPAPHRNAAAHQRALAAGLLQAVVGALQHHQAREVEDEGFFEKSAVRALNGLLHDATPATKQLAYAAGALPVVLAALRAHLADASTLQFACGCLRWATWCGLTTRLARRRFMMALGWRCTRSRARPACRLTAAVPCACCFWRDTLRRGALPLLLQSSAL
jgi:hypothetical protein